MRARSPNGPASSLTRLKAERGSPDVVIAGGGPVGLSLAIHLARRGLSVQLFERQALPADKACGEGLMPPGVEELEWLGVRGRFSGDDCARLESLRYVQEDGTSAEAVLPDGGGLGIRRTALSAQLLGRARELGALVFERSRVASFRRTADGIAVSTERGEVHARFLVAADGLASPLRRAERLDAGCGKRRRFGLRRHVRMRPWSTAVEVHFSGAAEAYVTPVGSERVGVAILWDADLLRGPVSFEALLSRFPALVERIGTRSFDSSPRGAGPMSRSVRARTADHFALLGDAAGYADALSGEGLALGFRCARLLADVLPDALVRGADRHALRRYEESCAQWYRWHESVTRSLLFFTRHPALRKGLLRWLFAHPRSFAALVRLATRPFGR